MNTPIGGEIQSGVYPCDFQQETPQEKEECDDDCENCKDEDCPLQGDKIIVWQD